MFKLILFISFVFFNYSALAEINISHGIAMHGEPKYKKEFKHVDYANPTAFKGGKIVFSSIGTYDTFNPFSLKGIAADGIAADDGRIGADRRPAPDQGGREFILALDKGARRQNVGEDHGGAKEDLILDRHAGVDGNVILNFDALTQVYVGADHDVLAQHAVFADHTAAKDMAKMPNLAVIADGHAVVDQGGRMDVRF